MATDPNTVETIVETTTTIQIIEKNISSSSEVDPSREDGEKKKRQLPSSWDAPIKPKEEAIENYLNNKSKLKSETNNDAVEQAIFVREELPVLKGRVVCFDLETSGFSGSDRILEIGATELIDGKKTRVHFRSYCLPTLHQKDKKEEEGGEVQNESSSSQKPEGSEESSSQKENSQKLFTIHPMAFEAHNISEEMLKKEDPTDIVLRDFADFIFGAKLLVAHNAAFDIRMLTNELRGYSISPHDESPKFFCTQR